MSKTWICLALATAVSLGSAPRVSAQARVPRRGRTRSEAGGGTTDRRSLDRPRWEQGKPAYENLTPGQKQALLETAVANIDTFEDWTQAQKVIAKKNVTQLIEGFNDLGDPQQQALLNAIDTVKDLPLEQKQTFVANVRAAVQEKIDAMTPEQKQDAVKAVQRMRQR